MVRLPKLSTRQFLRYLARYVRDSPWTTRVTAPAKRIRVPDEPGVGIFFYPADSWIKTRAFGVGPLGETAAKIHPSRFQIARSVSPQDGGGGSELLYWGVGGAVKVTKNLLSGVSEGFAVSLELHGIGFRVEEDADRGVAIFRLGFSHTIELPMKDKETGTFFNIINPQLLQVAGVNREAVHQRAAKVRALRSPEPYKGKGIRYMSEPIKLKETKKD